MNCNIVQLLLCVAPISVYRNYLACLMELNARTQFVHDLLECECTMGSGQTQIECVHANHNDDCVLRATC